MKEKKNGMDMLNGKGDDDWVKLCTKLVGREQLPSASRRSCEEDIRVCN